MNKNAPLLFLLLALALGACSNKYRRDFGGGESPPANGVKVAVRTLPDVAALEQSLAEGAILFDLREYDDWVQGHIPGARSIAVADLRQGRGLPDDLGAPLVFTGEGPMDTRPERAAEAAIDRGHTNVQLFSGGWKAWGAKRILR